MATIARRRAYARPSAISAFAQPALGVGAAFVASTSVSSVTDWIPVDLGTWDIRPYLRLPGDAAYEIPDGYYYGGPLTNAPHPATTGIYKGYALFRPQSFRGGILRCDYPGKLLPNGQQANGDLNIVGPDAGSGGTSGGIIMAGFKVENGSLLTAARNVHGWYNEHTFPYTAWALEPGRSSASSYHSSNLSVKHNFGSVNTRVYGGYFHDQGVPWWPGPGSRATYNVGCIYERTADGGPTVDPADNVHPDSISIIQGNVWDCWVTDFDVRGGGTENGVNVYDFTNGASEQIHFARGWVHNCYGAGWTYASYLGLGGNHIVADMEDIHIWGNGTGAGGGGHQNDAPWQYFHDIDGTQYFPAIGSSPVPGRILATATSSDILVAQTGTDPATAWQQTAGQGYDDILDFFDNLGWPRS